LLEGRRLWFVGIGGAGMSALALVAREWGAEVGGSDRARSSYVERLEAAGIPVAMGHDAANVPDNAEVIVSSAIAPDNPEVAGREVRKPGELLAELVDFRPSIVVAGAHGKTTTAAMIAFCLDRLGLDPAYLIGGEVPQLDGNARAGGGWLVAEGDESDRSLELLHPRIAAVTNVELDHHATFGSLAEVREVFRRFLAAAPEAVLWDRPDVVELRGGRPFTAFDVPAPHLDGDGSSFAWRDQRVRLRVPGAHNARNAAAALEASLLAGADPARAAAALADFAGAGRRFQELGTTAEGARVVDDYAHHPTEVAATIDAARTQGPRRVVAVFQPHLYSRTQRLAREFGIALARADVVAVLDVYPARERAEDFPGVSGLLVAEAAADAANGRPVYWLPTFDAAERVLRAELRAGDLCLVLGAGDVDALGRRLLSV